MPWGSLVEGVSLLHECRRVTDVYAFPKYEKGMKSKKLLWDEEIEATNGMNSPEGKSVKKARSYVTRKAERSIHM